MKALILALKKIITVIVAVLLPATQVAPPVATVFYGQPEAYSIQNEAPEAYENEEYDIVEDEQNIEENTENVPVQEPQIDEDNAIGEEPMVENGAAPMMMALTRDEEFVPVQTWDVSATEDDDVTLAFYDTEDVEGLLAQLAGRVTALFAPMVAYAAEDDRETATVEVFYENGYLERGTDYGNGENAPAAEPEYYDRGTVVVYGTGEMQEYVYNYFMSKDKYIATAKALLEEYYTEELGEEVVIVPEYDDSIEDVVELDATIDWRIEGTDEYVYFNDEIRLALKPTDMLAFSPTTIIIEPGVTNISDAAFALCADIVRVEIPETVTEIGCDAFAYCKNLQSVVLPQSLEFIAANAFGYCEKLETVNIPANVVYVGTDAFAYLAEGSTIICPNERVANLFADWNYTIGRTVIEVR